MIAPLARSGLACFLGVMAAGCAGSTPARPSSGDIAPLAAPAGGAELPAVPASVLPWTCISAKADCPASHVRTSRAATAASIPGVPGTLTGSVRGNQVTLSWGASSDQPASYIVEAGSRSGATDIAVFDTGNTGTLLVVGGVPDGVYYIRVRASNAAGTSATSNEIVLTVGGGGACLTAPQAPTALGVTVDGSAVTLAWLAPSTGCAPTSYTIEAGSTSGASDLATFSTGSTATTFSTTGVADGTYFVRVRATNGGGSSGASNEVPLTVRVAAPAPTPSPAPADLSGTYSLSFNTSTSCQAAKSISSNSFKIAHSGSTLTVTNSFYVLLSNIGASVPLPILSFGTGWRTSRFTCDLSGAQVTCPASASDQMGIIQVPDIVALSLKNSLQVIGRTSATAAGNTIAGTLSGRVGQVTDNALTSDCTATDHRIAFTRLS